MITRPKALSPLQVSFPGAPGKHLGMGRDGVCTSVSVAELVGWAPDQARGHSWRMRPLLTLAETPKRSSGDDSRSHSLRAGEIGASVIAPRKRRCRLEGFLGDAESPIHSSSRISTAMSAWRLECRAILPAGGPRRLSEPGAFKGTYPAFVLEGFLYE